MSGIGSVGGPERQVVKHQQTAQKQNQNQKVRTEPQDKVEIKKDISKPRKVIEKVLGSPMGVINAAGNAFGGVFGGGVASVSKDSGEGRTTHVVMTGIANTAMGATAGTMLGGPIGGIAGGVAGVFYTILSGESKSLDRVAEEVTARGARAGVDNEKSDLEVRDAVRDFTEGGIVGAVEGGVEGFRDGITYGEGMVSGLIEGAKGLAGSITGAYEKKEVSKPEPQKEEGPKTSFSKKVLKTVGSVPRKLSKMILGTATGAANAALGVLDGAIQGTVVGMDDDEKASAAAHRLINGIQLAVAGTVAGVTIAGGGWIPAAVGLGVGAAAGAVTGFAGKATDSGDEYAKGITDAVKHAGKDNIYKAEADGEYQDKNVYETFRDGIEGALTGAGAGVREGFSEGRKVGDGIVDGVFDGAEFVAKHSYRAAKGVAKGVYHATKGIAKGVTGGIKGSMKKVENEKPAEAKPEVEAEKKSFVKKAVEFPGKAVKKTVGTMAGALSAPLHVLPGMARGAEIAKRGYDKSAPFTRVMFLQNVALGAGAGFAMGGVIGAAIGGVGGMAYTGLTNYMGERNHPSKYDKMGERMEKKIETALEDNKEAHPTEKFFQDGTEAAIIGAVESVREGFKVGSVAGESTVSGVVDTVEGVVEGAVEVGGNVLRGGPRPTAEEK
ncbi:MAG: hypothetical protein ACLFQV_07645 [Vulcanimicrobiota bacterium]